MPGKKESMKKSEPEECPHGKLSGGICIRCHFINPRSSTVKPEAVCDCYKSPCRCTCHGGGLVRHFVDAQPEAQEIVLHKPDEGDEFAWTQCDGPDDICSDPRQSENWQHAVAVLRRKP